MLSKTDADMIRELRRKSAEWMLWRCGRWHNCGVRLRGCVHWCYACGRRLSTAIRRAMETAEEEKADRAKKGTRHEPKIGPIP